MGADEMMNCTMSCCQTSDKPLVTAVAFVVPKLALTANSVSVSRVAEPALAIEISRFARSLSPLLASRTRCKHVSIHGMNLGRDFVSR